MGKPDNKKFLCPGCDTELEMVEGKRPDACGNCGTNFIKAETLFKLLTVGAKLSKPEKAGTDPVDGLMKFLGMD